MNAAEYAEAIKNLPADEQIELLEALQRYERAVEREKATSGFLNFVREMWPAFIYGQQHKIMADIFDNIIKGKSKRVIISMPPRHTKSEFGSWLLPAYFLGHFPTKKIIQCSNTADLAVNFGKKVRDTIGSIEYQNLFKGVALKADSKASGHWHTNQGGEYFAIGVDGAVTGKGADLLVIDDPHSEQEAKLAERKPEIFDAVYDWYTSGPRQRLQPNGVIVIIMTRWSKRDLAARAINQSIQSKGKNEWEVIELPAILPSGKTLWPEYWPEDQIFDLRDSLPLHKWLAQYQQTPTGGIGSLIKKEDWQMWPRERPMPASQIKLSSWDTAFGDGERGNYSARTDWIVFREKVKLEKGAEEWQNRIMLVGAARTKAAFPELKAIAKEHDRRWKPDITIIEKKAAGAPLIYELRAAGIPVMEYTPSRGNDKMVRVNAVTDIFHSKYVYALEGRASEEVIEECADFPSGEADDYVDTVTQALLRFRQGGLIGSRQDHQDEDEPQPRRSRKYY